MSLFHAPNSYTEYLIETLYNKLTFGDRLTAEKSQLERTLIQHGCYLYKRKRFGFGDFCRMKTVWRDIRDYQAHTGMIIYQPRRESRKRIPFSTPRKSWLSDNILAFELPWLWVDKSLMFKVPTNCTSLEELIWTNKPSSPEKSPGVGLALILAFLGSWLSFFQAFMKLLNLSSRIFLQ